VRQLIAIWLVCAAACAGAGVTVAAQQTVDRTPVVYTADVDSIIHPVSADFMIATMAQADQAGAALVVFTLRTPGGLVDATRDIVTHMIAAKTPVAVFVGPSGARAASAGFLLTIAADVAAMAPGTHIGAAHPVSGNGEPSDDTMSKKAAEDVAAYARTLASARGRNVDLAAEAVRNSRAFTNAEAIAASPPLVDVIAADVPDLLRKVDGRTVRRFDGRAEVLHTANARIVPVAMSLRQRVLSFAANPNIAYLLLSLGTLGLTIELWSPGAIVPGVVGSVSLLLAFFALQILPVNIAGLLLLLLGILLLVLEIKVTSFGLLTAGGLVSLTFGSMMLFDSNAPELQVSLRVIIPVVLGCVAIAASLVRLAVASQRRPPVSGAAGLVGSHGEALSPLGPETTGQVLAHGEIWRARAEAPIAKGDTVTIESVDGLTLTVRED
jgi:membrane-bound serine protease (ClpP class)